MSRQSWLTGKRAELAAKRYLKRLGYLIVECNVHLGRDEIDLVAVHQEVVVFVEVRFRSAGLEAAELSVAGAKSRRVRRAVAAYLGRENLWSVPHRIDVMAITRFRGSWHISHIKDAFQDSSGGGSS